MSYRDSPYIRPRMRELIRGFWRCMGHGAVGYGMSMEAAYHQWLERRAAYLMHNPLFAVHVTPPRPTWRTRLLDLICRGSTNSAGPGGRPTRV